jgi:tetratricopeptide (TPR) repeat protein
MRFLLASIAAVLASGGAPAHAAWYQASSKHFVIYADESPKELSEFATKLERFDQAVRHVRGMDDPPVGLGNRLTVFVLPSVGAVQKLMNGDQFIEGFYTGRASGSYAFVPRTTGAEGPNALHADTIFFHEYAHHLMFQIVDRPLPQWVVEGFAEFMSTVRFEKNGDIGLGAPANHRAWGLLLGDKLPIETMLSGNFSKLNPEMRESLYGRGWLLVHYLTFETSRAGQLDRYVDLLSKGTPALDAARTAFGDLKRLDRDLDSYLRRSSLSYLRLGGARFQPGKIDVQPLGDGAAKVVMLRVQSKRGVDQKTAEPLARQVRAVEGRYPGNELVELTLAEAELDAGHPEASEAAADRVLKVNPNDTKAMVFKGRATLALALKEAGEKRRAACNEARSLFVAANKLDTEDPEPLMEFYKSFVAEGIRPNDNAIAALHYASDLAPQDIPLRLNSALQYLRDGNASEARKALTVIAYDPHGEQLAQVARSMIEKIDAGNTRDALAVARADDRPGTAPTPN